MVMKSSELPSIQTNADAEQESTRRKRRKTENERETHHINRIGKRWRTEKEQQIYSLKLYEALLRARRSSPVSGGRKVRETADRVLAASARGATRWSREILGSRVRARLMRKHKKAKVVTSNNRLRKLDGQKKLPPVEKRVRILGLLVPGCRKLALPDILEEATDYIAALEMQVRAMKALAEILAGSQHSSRLGSASNTDSSSL